MFQAQEKYFIRCFLCRIRATQTKPHKNIERVKCPSSQKSVKEVLQYLGQKAQIELSISENEFLCLGCYQQIVNYDTHLVELLRQQRILSQRVEKALTSVDSDFEEECKQEVEDCESFDDEEFVEDLPTAQEIDKTIKEAMANDMPSFSFKPKACHLCNMRFRSKMRLHKHIEQTHKKFRCDQCDYSHRNVDHVMLHKNIHEGRKENQCRFCHKEFTTKISTIRHMEVHLDAKKYQCDKCGLCFSQTTVLYNHKLQHEAEEQPLRCDICQQLFKTKRTYRHHILTHRADRPRYGCEACGKTFTEKYTLKVHMRTHSEAVSNSHQLQKQETMQHNVIEQQQVSANADGKFNCIICDQTFGNKEHLNRHMEKEHDVILKSLTLSNFSQYEVVTNEPKKACHTCGLMFSTNANLDLHLEQMHAISFK